MRRSALPLVVLVAACPGSHAALPDASAPDAAPAVTITVHVLARAPFAVAAPADADWLAVQDGDGAFAPLAPTTTGTYTFVTHDPHGRYGVAVAPADGSGATILEASAAEGTDPTLVLALATPPSTYRGVYATGCQASAVQIVNSTAIGPCNQTASALVLTGAYDAIGVSYASGAIADVAIVRDTSDPSVLIDFGASGQPAAIHHVTVAGNGEWLYRFMTPRGIFATNHFATGDYPGVPASLRDPDDVHSVCVIGGACHWSKEPIDVDDTGLPPTATPSATVSGTTISWQPYLASGFRAGVGTWSAWLSAGWLDRQTSYALPRLCDVAGFPGACLSPTASYQWAFQAYKPAGGFVASLVDILAAESYSPLARDGLTYAVAVTSGRS